jgi:hypothetical protein
LLDDKPAYRTSMISKVKGKARDSVPRSEGAGAVCFCSSFHSALFLVPVVDAEPDIHLLSRAEAVTDV